MSENNFQRLIQLADEVFAYKSDPDQLDINPQVIERLKQIHPATMSEYADENGPVVWILVIPTTMELMHQFLEKKITEKMLYQFTPLHVKYDALYLCSALVLEEYRRKGITKQLLLDALANIRKDHPLKCLFVWPFSKEGDALAENIAMSTSMPLYKRMK